jgi:hypothetical protein
MDTAQIRRRVSDVLDQVHSFFLSFPLYDTTASSYLENRILTIQAATKYASYVCESRLNELMELRNDLDVLWQLLYDDIKKRRDARDIIDQHTNVSVTFDHVVSYFEFAVISAKHDDLEDREAKKRKSH